MEIKRRIFVSAPHDDVLSQDENDVKNGIIKKLEDDGFQIERFFVSGEAESLPWTFPNVRNIISKCVGVLIMAYPRWSFEKDNRTIHLTSEYVHFEGAVAIEHSIPLFVMSDERVEKRVLTDLGHHRICFIPQGVTTAFLQDRKFTQAFANWLGIVKNRHDLFFGYSSKARYTALKISRFLGADLGLRVMDWEVDFTAGQSILQAIEGAAKQCSGGIFLFTKDDELLNGTENAAAPRDNVVFEAGMFIQAKGKERVLIIREAGAKMPADLGGDIYLQLNDSESTQMIENSLRKFIRNRL